MYQKIIISNNIIELYSYERLNINEKCQLTNTEKHEDKDTNIFNYQRSQKRRRETLRRLICTNFTNNNSKFITLTFRDDIRDVKVANREFKNFIMRLNYYMRKKNDKFKLNYVAVIEFQDKNRDGVVHYHMICDLPYIPRKYIESTWGQGFIKVNRIDKVDNLGAYVTKYMNKDIDDNRLMGLKAYNCSKDLKRPVVLRNWNDQENKSIESILKMYDLDKKNPVYQTSYTGDEIGEIKYKQYNLSRN